MLQIHIHNIIVIENFKVIIHFCSLQLLSKFIHSLVDRFLWKAAVD